MTALALLLLLSPLTTQTPNTVSAIKPIFATESVAIDADDPAFFVDQRNPLKSLIIGTDKSKSPDGGLFVFDLKGKIIQKVIGLDRPNNVDVGYNLKTPKGLISVAVTTERYARQLRIFSCSSQGQDSLSDITGNTKVFVGEQGEDSEPMGIACGSIDGKLYAFVTPKAGPKTGHCAQYLLVFNPNTSKVDAILVRRFGLFSGIKETESVAFDAFYKRIVYSDETIGTRICDARPKAKDVELKFFNNLGTKGDHEGIGIWESDKKGNGWIVCTDQIEENSIYRVFDRKTQAFVGAFSGGADSTDGIDISSELGIMVAMNSKDKNYLVYRLKDIAKALGLKPTIKPQIRL